MNVVYQIRNMKTNKVYVGSAVNFQKRKANHLWLLKNNTHHSLALQRAWNKYGQENFVFEILEENIDLERLIEIEQKFIDERGFGHGYNMYPTAESPRGRICSESTREKFRTKALGNKYHLGKNHSVETKETLKLKLKEFYQERKHPRKGAGQKIGQFENGFLIRVWESGYEAAKILGLKVGPIYQACNGNKDVTKSRTSYGFIWKFLQ